MVMKNGKTVITDILAHHLQQRPQLEGFQSLISVPIKARKETIGVLDVLTKEHRDFSPEDISLVESIGLQIGVASENAKHGAGGVGLSAVQVATAVGGMVIAVDVDDAKLVKAKEEGAVAVINARKENVVEAIKEITKGGAHASIDALGIRETILNSVLSLRKGGRHVQIGLTTKEEGGMVDLPMPEKRSQKDHSAIIWGTTA